jgi:uncharacterized membrane protein
MVDGPGTTFRMPRGRILPGYMVGLFAVSGLLAGGLTALMGALVLAPLVGWIVASGTALLWVWWVVWSHGPDATERLAREDAGSRPTDTVITVAALFSLGAVGLAQIRSNQSMDAVGVAAILLSVAVAVNSWALVNTVYGLKYARLYYLHDKQGIDFQTGESPSYSDFAYVAFTIGMSYAVSDTSFTSSVMRRAALAHSLLSYAFGTVVLAVAITLVTNLGR